MLRDEGLPVKQVFMRLGISKRASRGGVQVTPSGEVTQFSQYPDIVHTRDHAQPYPDIVHTRDNFVSSSLNTYHKSPTEPTDERIR